jgi:hypothetical protein
MYELIEADSRFFLIFHQPALDQINQIASCRFLVSRAPQISASITSTQSALRVWWTGTEPVWWVWKAMQAFSMTISQSSGCSEGVKNVMKRRVLLFIWAANVGSVLTNAGLGEN